MPGLIQLQFEASGILSTARRMVKWAREGYVGQDGIHYALGKQLEMMADECELLAEHARRARCEVLELNPVKS